MSFLGGVFGSKNREIPEDEQPLIDDQARDESNAFAQAALHEFEEGAAAPHAALSGRVHRESGDRADALVQQRLGISQRSPSSRAADYLARETPYDDRESLLSPGSPRSEDSMASVTSRRVRFNQEGGLEFLRSINPVVAMRAKSIILQFFNWIGDLIAKLRGKSDERFKSQVMEFARKDVAMCALLNLEGNDLKKVVLDILRESSHPLTRELDTIRAELKDENLDLARAAELTARKEQIKESLKSVANAFCEAVSLVANEVSYLKANQQLDYVAVERIHTIAEFERYIIQGHGCGEVDLVKLFQENTGVSEQKNWIIDRLSDARLPLADKIDFLNAYGLLDEQSAFDVISRSTFISFEDDLKSMAKLEESGIHSSFSLLKTRSESIVKDIGNREGFDPEVCTLEQIDSRLTSSHLDELQKKDPFVRQLFQAWALAKPDVRAMTAAEIKGSTIAQLLANRKGEITDRSIATNHVLSRMSTALALAQYMCHNKEPSSSKNLLQLQLFISMCPYGRGPDGKTPLFDALGNTNFFKVFDEDLDAQIEEINLPYPGQPLDDYVGKERTKLDELHQKRATCLKPERAAVNKEIDEQTRIVILMHFVHFRAQAMA